jgi:hypothetical protein
LTTGIAHDFNNMLAAIEGNVDLGLLEVAPDHSAYECLTEILTSGYVRPEDAECAQAIGAGEIVLKPHSIHDLTQVIHQRLNPTSRVDRSGRRAVHLEAAERRQL